MAPLDSVNYKIVRAITHLKELQVEIESYFKTNPGKIVRQQEGEPDQFIGKLEAKGPIPARLPIIVGDCLQNLRSSLDYLIWELVITGNNQPSRENMFPISNTPDAFKVQLARRRLNGVPKDAATEIELLQPYHLGQDFDKAMLWVIDDLCNINKHRRLLLTHLHGSPRPDDLELLTVKGDLWAQIDVTTMKRETKIGPFPIIDGKVQMDAHVIAFLSFDEGAAQNLDVCFVLNELLRFVSYDIVPRFERFFS